MITYSKEHSTLLLEEVFQLLRETLLYSPFIPTIKHPTKKHLLRLKQLLNPDFTFLLADTGAVIFSALMAAKCHIDKVCNAEYSSKQKYSDTKELYDQLLLSSQLAMSTGLCTERYIESLLQIKQTLKLEQQQEMYEIIDAALNELQNRMCNFIKNLYSYS